ncbi:MAG: UDP-N-acetylglucosamine 2-epimerase, partial [Flavobacteriales bacterium]
KDKKIVFPIHPRSKKRFEEFGLWDQLERIDRLTLTGPMDYFGFQKLVKYANSILTDSGGIQEESTFRQVPCYTIRENTERPITCSLGTNQLVTANCELILEAMKNPKSGSIPPLWDGKATWRVLEKLIP